MLNDSVREELAGKITPLPKTEKPKEIKFELPKPSIMASDSKLEPIKMSFAPMKSAELSIPPTKFVEVQASAMPIASVVNQKTSQIMPKPTSQTLVDFQSKNATLPDWRLQLQNSVRKRLDEQKTGDGSQAAQIHPNAPRRITAQTAGASALKAEISKEAQPVQSPNPTIANALKRIEESRNKYLISQEPVEFSQAQTHSTVKQFPRVAQNNSLEYLPKTDQEQLAQISVKPNVVQFSTEPKAEKYDTAKLPPIPLPAKISSSFDKKLEPRKIELAELEEAEIHRTSTDEVLAYSESEAVENIEETEEIDDFAPVSLRFNSAIFDLLIGSFLSFVLLAPLMLLSGRFFSIEGFFAFLATWAIVMFIYMTTTIAFLGRTFGMRLFALEIVDIEENDYPTLHQAAVSSSVYLLSLALGGLGFLPMLLNSEKRAAHDLLSKTIVVKEY